MDRMRAMLPISRKFAGGGFPALPKGEKDAFHVAGRYLLRYSPSFSLRIQMLR